MATARDGVEALRRLENAWPDLVLLDMMMPRLDGISLAREIKARADLPIIVLTAIDAADSKAELLDEVAEDYVTKPYHYPELRARINRVLRRLGDRLPGQRIELGPDLALELGRRAATVNGTEVSLTPDRVAAPLRAGREPGPDRLDRDPARPRLGRHGGRRSLVRLGHDAPPSPEDRARREPAAPPGHRPRASATAWRQTRRDPVPDPDHRGAAHRGTDATRRVRRAADGLRPGRLRRQHLPDPARRVRDRRAARCRHRVRGGRQA